MRSESTQEYHTVSPDEFFLNRPVSRCSREDLMKLPIESVVCLLTGIQALLSLVNTKTRRSRKRKDRHLIRWLDG